MNEETREKTPAITTTPISQYLRGIPGPDEDWLSLSPVGQSADTELMATIVAVLAPFNAIAGRRQGNTIQIRARSEAARLFLLSLAAFIDTNTPIVQDWQRKGVREERFGYQDLSQGVQLLYAFERLRLDYPEPQPIRHARVVKAILKAEVDGIPKYLVQYDARTHGFQLIGGHVVIPNELEEDAIKREISEELRQNHFEFGRNARVQRLGSVRAHEMSRTIGAFTEYDITYFQLFVDFDLQTRTGDTWVTAEELAEGKTRDKAPIWEAALSKVLEDVPADLTRLSIGAPRVRTPRSKRVFEVIDRNIDRIGVFLTALGLLVSVVVALFSKECSAPTSTRREPAVVHQSRDVTPSRTGKSP